MEISIEDTENLALIYKENLSKDLDNNDLIWLLIDLKNAFNEKQKINIRYGLWGELLKGGIAEKITVKYFSSTKNCTDINIKFINDSKGFNLKVARRKVVAQDNTAKYYIYKNEIIEYSVVIHNKNF